MTQFCPFHLVYSEEYLAHDTGGGEHPEIPQRLQTIMQKMHTSLLAPQMTIVPPRIASREEVLAFHDESYLYRFEESTLSGKTSLDHNDNQICYDSYDIAFLSAGGGLTGIDLIEQSDVARVFCTVRPPGHHAERSLALGFCFFNNAVLAAKYWQQRFGRTKIAIIDWDAHHGNGIQSAFEEDPTVLYVSIHEHPTFSFPGTGLFEEKGVGAGRGTTVNLPLPPGADDKMVLKCLQESVEPALSSFQPDALIVAAGFDGHQLDDMSGLQYSTTLYGQLGVWMNVLAEAHCKGKILSILEGGYHCEALAASVEAYIAGLCARRPVPR